jgi:hypothetical protein
MSLPDDLNLNLPTDIPGWPPGSVPVEVWLAEQQQIIDEYRKSPDYEEHRRRKFENAVPFVWKD